MLSLRLACPALLIGAAIAAGGKSSPESMSEPFLVIAAGDAGVEFANPQTLDMIGRFHTGLAAYNVLAPPEGHMLVVAQPRPEEPHVCCALFALELNSREFVPLIFPALGGRISHDGEALLTQRGNTEIDVVDLKKLALAHPIGEPGKNYSIFPSPDGRFLFAVTAWPGPASVDVFDFATKQLVHQWRVPDPPAAHNDWPHGAWLGDTFYLFSYTAGHGRLWKLKTDGQPNGEPIRLDLPSLSGACNCKQPNGSTKQPVALEFFAAGDQLILHESFGGKIDPRDGHHQVDGGYYVVDPFTGSVKAYLDKTSYFGRLEPTPDGSALYGIDWPASDARPGAESMLLKLRPDDGGVLASRKLDGQAFSLAWVSLPPLLVPRGTVEIDTSPRAHAQTNY